MKKSKLKNGFEFSNFYIIKNISYRDIFPFDDKESELQITDSIDTNYDNENKKLYFTITRKISFEPSSLFDLEVSISSLLTKKEKFNYDSREMSTNDFVDTFGEEICTVCSRISTIISSVTMMSNNVPLVTPPQLIIED